MTYFEILCEAENGAWYHWLNAYKAWEDEKTDETLAKVNEAREKLGEIRKMIDDHRKGKK